MRFFLFIIQNKLFYLKGFYDVYRNIYTMKKKQCNLIIRLTENEKKMIDKLRSEGAINISALIRTFIKDYYEKSKSIHSSQ